MTLSKRSSRNISIDGLAYQWAIAARSQASTGSVTLVIHPPDNGQRLAVEIPCRDPYLNNTDSEPKCDVRSVTPKLVRKLIESAVSIGWTPAESRPQLDIPFAIATMRDDDGESGSTCHACWQCPSCDEWHSEDVKYNSDPPLVVTCGRSNHHPTGIQTPVVLFW